MPLIVGDRRAACSSLDDLEREHAFSESDVRLLETVANSMSVALENARLFDETQRLLKETERRSSELAVINSIQQGMAKELNFQAIVDLVGDKLRELFATGDLAIHWRDEKTNIVHHLYVYEHGQRLPHRTTQYKPEAAINKALQTGKPVVMGDRAAMDAVGLKVVEGTDASLSCVFVPVMVGERLIAAISIESFEREHAFDEAEVHLLSTIAASMGVALENARLLEETQRRARESSALSDVGRDLLSTLDLSTVMDRIATHAKDLLNAGNSAIFLPDQGGTTYRAIVAVGETADAIKATVIEGGVGIIGTLLKSGEPELINDTQADPRGVQIAGTERQHDERLMVVPLARRRRGRRRNGGLAHGRRAVRRPRSRIPGRPLAPGDRRASQRAPVQRDAGGARAADRHGRNPAGDQRIADRRAARCSTRSSTAASDCSRTSDLAVCLVDSGELRIGAYRGGFADAGRAYVPAARLPARSSDMRDPARRRAAPFERTVRRRIAARLRSTRWRAGLATSRRERAHAAWEGRAIGTIDIVCRPSRGRFRKAELALLKTFADQAVIAIQNARLFNETQGGAGAADRHRRILRVISRSPTTCSRCSTRWSAPPCSCCHASHLSAASRRRIPSRRARGGQRGWRLRGA